jgi:conjugal transfer/entry exclusion protein
MEDQPNPDNVVQIREQTEAEKTEAIMTAYSSAVCQATPNMATNVLMAIIAIQGEQLQNLVELLAETGRIDPKEFNRRVRVSCKKKLEKLKAPKIVVASQVPPVQ